MISFLQFLEFGRVRRKVWSGNLNFEIWRGRDKKRTWKKSRINLNQLREILQKISSQVSQIWERTSLPAVLFFLSFRCFPTSFLNKQEIILFPILKSGKI